MAENILRSRTAAALNELIKKHGKVIVDGVVVRALVDHLTNVEGLTKTSVKDAEHVLKVVDKLIP